MKRRAADDTFRRSALARSRLCRWRARSCSRARGRAAARRRPVAGSRTRADRGAAAGDCATTAARERAPGPRAPRRGRSRVAAPAHRFAGIWYARRLPCGLGPARPPVPTLVYRHRQHLISLSALPLGRAAPIPPEQIAGYNIVSWTENGLAYWAVSDLAAADLNAFAKAFRTAGQS